MARRFGEFLPLLCLRNLWITAACSKCLSTAFWFNLASPLFISCGDRCFSNTSSGPKGRDAWEPAHFLKQIHVTCASGATSVWVQILLQHPPQIESPREHLDTLPVAQNNHNARLFFFVRLHVHLVKEWLSIWKTQGQLNHCRCPMLHMTFLCFWSRKTCNIPAGKWFNAKVERTFPSKTPGKILYAHAIYTHTHTHTLFMYIICN